MLASSQLASREWRLLNLYTIRNADGVLEPFTPNLAQRAFYNRYWYCNHVLKARKLGFSTFIEILFLDDLLFTPLRAGIIDYTIEDAQTKLSMLRTSWENLSNGDIHPDTWRIGEAIQKAVPMQSSSRHIKFGNGSEIRCSTSLRGETPQRIHISELGKTSIWAPIKAREIVNGAFNAITPGSVRNIETTHEGGKVGENFRLLNNCMRLDDHNLSPIQSRFHFFPWYLDPRYRIHQPGASIRPEIRKYFKRISRELPNVTFTHAQILWYDHKHLEQGHGMKKEFPTTPGEAFEATFEGSIYGTQIADLRAAGRITEFLPEANYPIYAFWDIGLSDYTAIWIIQPVSRHFLVLDWFEAEGLPGSAMPDAVRQIEARLGRNIATHFLPHDAETRDRGTGKTYVSVLKEGGLHHIRIVPRTPDVWLGIGYARDVLPHCWFNSAKCDVSRTRNGRPRDPEDTGEEEFPSGLACLEGYAKDTGAAATMRLREMPKHDLFSHSADAFRTFAEAFRRGLIEPHGQSDPTKHKPRAIR